MHISGHEIESNTHTRTHTHTHTPTFSVLKSLKVGLYYRLTSLGAGAWVPCGRGRGRGRVRFRLGIYCEL
jgi:hypothetical protein